MSLEKKTLCPTCSHVGISSLGNNLLDSGTEEATLKLGKQNNN
jgi:hypothetical protein